MPDIGAAEPPPDAAISRQQSHGVVRIVEQPSSEARVHTDMFRDRTDAGARLAAAVKAHVHAANPLVLALPRGGVPVAAEISRALNAPLDVLIVRKLGHPLQPELAIGAVASGGVRVLNPEFTSAIAPDVIAEIAGREVREVERLERLLRGSRPRPTLIGRDVILVDDGLATGATMLAAVRAARAAGARHVVVAVPVGDPGTCVMLGREADRVLCPLQPVSLTAVGAWYADFAQVGDDEVRRILDRDPAAQPETRLS